MLIRTQFPDLTLATALPAIEELIYAGYDDKGEQYSKYFRVMQAKKGGITQTSGRSGLGLLTTINEGGDVRYDDIVATANKTYLALKYGLGFKVTREMIDDDKFGMVADIAKDLGNSAKETVEIVAADVVNGGFTNTGPDGQALFSVSHPLYKSGGLGVNRLNPSADLSITALDLAIADMRRTKNHAGLLDRFYPSLVVVSLENQLNAAEILASTMRSDTAENAINGLRHLDQPNLVKFSVWDYLTDPDAWFLWTQKERTDLRLYWTQKFRVRHDSDFDSNGAKTAGDMRFAVGYQEWGGVYGSSGA